MEHLLISLCAPKGLLREVKRVIYADTRMTKDLEVLGESIAPEPDPVGEKFVFDIQKPNLMYGYAVEWIFGEPNDPAQSSCTKSDLHNPLAASFLSRIDKVNQP